MDHDSPKIYGVPHQYELDVTASACFMYDVSFDQTIRTSDAKPSCDIHDAMQNGDSLFDALLLSDCRTMIMNKKSPPPTQTGRKLTGRANSPSFYPVQA